MRRKILSFILALTLMAGMGSIAYADELSGSGSAGLNSSEFTTNHPTIDVGVDYNEGKPEVVYKINIKWEDMIFKFGYSKPKKWNPSTHQYEVDLGTQYKWDNRSCKVTVTNKSNAKVNVTAEYAPKDGGFKRDGFNVKFAKTSSMIEAVTLKDASDNYDDTLEKSYVFMLIAEFENNYPAVIEELTPKEQEIGTVTIAVSDPNVEPSP